MKTLDDIAATYAARRLIPYLGPAMLSLCPDYAVPGSAEALVATLTMKASVPPKIRNNLTRSAQFIENFKHRKTLVNLMNEAYAAPARCSPLHARLSALDFPLIVDSWYDDAMIAAFAGRDDWGQIQGLCQSEHFGQWTGHYDANGAAVDGPVPARWKTILYKPLGGHAPAANYLVSDTDFVEVLTEIDIQTPIPDIVKDLRAGRSFLFLGCRFNDQLARSFARQVMKRSSDRHWAVLPDAPTRMEARFLAEQNITRIEAPLAAFAESLVNALAPRAAAA
jgi:hypothetical protein